ncbi:hypothetical protein SCUP234_12480 [Seiridium cupressi]
MESSTSSTSLQPGSMHAELAHIVDSTSQPNKAPAAGNCVLQDGQAQHSGGESPKMFPVDADPESTPPDDDSRNSPALRASLMQLDLLDKQNKKRIKLSRQGLDTPTTDGDERSPLQEKMTSRNHALQAYQVQLKFLEQQNKRRLLISGALDLPAAKADQAEDLPSEETWEDSPAQHDHQSQLLLLQEQNKKRLRTARADQDLGRSKLDESSEPLSDEKPKHPYTYWPKLEELDRRHCERKKQAEQAEQQSEDGHSVPDPSPVLEKLQSILLEDAETICQGAEGPRCHGELPGNYVKEDFTDIAASILSNVLRSPHDMNALLDENTPKRAKLESTLVQHDESAVDAALRRQHDLQKLQQSRKPTSPSASALTSTSSPGFAPASFEYKGPPTAEIVESPPPPRRSCGYGVFSMRKERARKPVPSPDAADCERSMVDTFKNDNPAVVAQLKQIGSRRRSRRGQSSTTSPPRNTPISRIRGKAAVAAAGHRSPTMPSNGLPSPPPSHTGPSPKSVEVERADISCPEGVSLAIRLRVNV